MVCNGCVAKLTKHLKALREVNDVNISLDPPILHLHLSSHLQTQQINKYVAIAGDYRVDLMDASFQPANAVKSKNNDLAELKPLFIIVAYLIIGSLVYGYTSGQWNPANLMRVFMGLFFVVFSLFKMLDLEGFAKSYAKYDIIAGRFRQWAYAYPFVELSFGILLLTGLFLQSTYLSIVLVMSLSIIGVIQAVRNEQQIECACLGSVLNLPMTKVTIIEDATMIIMAAAMLFI